MQKSDTKIEVIASSQMFQIEFVKRAGANDYHTLIKIS